MLCLTQLQPIRIFFFSSDNQIFSSFLDGYRWPSKPNIKWPLIKYATDPDLKLEYSSRACSNMNIHTYMHTNTHVYISYWVAIIFLKKNPIFTTLFIIIIVCLGILDVTSWYATRDKTSPYGSNATDIKKNYR